MRACVRECDTEHRSGAAFASAPSERHDLPAFWVFIPVAGHIYQTWFSHSRFRI